MKVKCTKCDFVLDETPWTTASERKFESHKCLSEFDKGRKEGAIEQKEKDRIDFIRLEVMPKSKKKQYRVFFKDGTEQVFEQERVGEQK